MIVSNIYCLSILDAQNIAREYNLENEFIDSRVFQINCEDQHFSVVSVVNARVELIFFVPIDREKNIYTEDDKTLENIFKTTSFLREITKQTQENYLNVTLIDSMDQLITILNSKKAQLNGVVTSDYSENITLTTKETREHLEQLVDLLRSLREGSDNALKSQQNFVNEPTCHKTSGVVIDLRDAFVGYNELTLYGLNYQNSINKITEAIVAEKEINETTKMIISGYVAAPPNLSKDISNIQERISSTHFFYNAIIADYSKIGENNPAIEAKNNFLSRQNYVKVNTLLYERDSDLKNTLDNIVRLILDETRYPYWKDRQTLSNLEENYEEINNLIDRKRHLEAIPKIKLLKSQAIKIENEGFVDISDVQEGYDYYIVFVVIILLVLLFLLLKKKKPSKKKKSKNQKPLKKSKDVLDSFKEKDPFK